MIPLPDLPGPRAAAAYLPALALGIVCGWIASRLGVPLPWMLGPMLGCGAASLAGAPLRSPMRLRPIVVPVIGVMLGSGFHPDLFDHVAAWTGTLLLLPPFLLLAGASSYVVFRRMGAYDPATAFYSAAPGGLNEMVLMGEEAGGDGNRIALAHSMRIFVVISAIALVFALFFGARSAGNAQVVGFGDLTPVELALLLGCAVFGAIAGERLRLPAAGLFGPMLASAVVHFTGVVSLPPPTLVVIAAQVVIGTILGCRFVGARLADTGRDMLLCVIATVAMLLVTFVFSVLVTWATGTATSQAALAFSPGGLAEMSLLALAMGEDVAYVATLHMVRIVIVLVTIPLVARLLAQRLFPDR